MSERQDPIKHWSGIWVAVVTPFSNGQVDVAALDVLLDRLLAAGIHGICPAGTTGEGSSLEDSDFELVLETVLKKAGGKIPVVAGTGSNNTQHTRKRN